MGDFRGETSGRVPTYFMAVLIGLGAFGCAANRAHSAGPHASANPSTDHAGHPTSTPKPGPSVALGHGGAGAAPSTEPTVRSGNVASAGEKRRDGASADTSPACERARGARALEACRDRERTRRLEGSDAHAARPGAATPSSGSDAASGAGGGDAALARGDGSAADRALIQGDEALSADDLDQAKRHFQRARQLAPTDPAARIGLLRVDMARSSLPKSYAALPKHWRVQSWLARANDILARSPGYAPAELERGRILLIMGRAQEARSALESALAELPRDPEAHSAHAVALLALGESEAALRAFRRSSELDPSNAERWGNLGTAYMMRGRVDEAVAAYERALALAPGNVRFRGDLGTALLAKNRPDLALPHLEQAVQLAPDRATFLSNLGYAQQQQGDVDAAIKSYRSALQKDRKLGSAWINLGTALVAKKQYPQAERAFNQALAIDPSDPRAQANLNELQQLRQQ